MDIHMYTCNCVHIYVYIKKKSNGISVSGHGPHICLHKMRLSMNCIAVYLEESWSGWPRAVFTVSNRLSEPESKRQSMEARWQPATWNALHLSAEAWHLYA